MELCEKGVAMKQISREVHIAESTLRDFLLQGTKVGRGPSGVLSREEEMCLLQFVDYMQRLGHPVGKEEILDVVQLLVSDGRQHNFTNGRPGKSWWDGFRHRNPEYELKRSQQISQQRANCATKSTLNLFFDRYEALVNSNNYAEIWNADEKPIVLDGKSRSLVFVKHDAKPVSRVGDMRDHVTVLLCVERSGRHMRPNFIYPGQKLPSCFVRGSDATFSTTENGYSTVKSKLEWFQSQFLTSCSPRTGPNPPKIVRKRRKIELLSLFQHLLPSFSFIFLSISNS